MISDMTGLSHIRVAFEPGQPFRPFQQLLAVLPAASAKLLPSAYQVLHQPSHSIPVQITLSLESNFCILLINWSCPSPLEAFALKPACCINGHRALSSAGL